MKKQKINHLAVWVAIVLSQLVPWLWQRLFEFTPFYETLPERVDTSASTPVLYVIGFLAAVVAMYLLEGLFIRLGVDSGQDGLVTGLIIGVVFNVFSLFTIYSFSAHPIEVGLIDFGSNALTFLSAGLVLGAWRKYEIEPA